MMRKSFRRILITLTLFSLLAFGVYYVYLTHHVFSPIEWEAAGGGLRLVYVPGKDQKFIFVSDEYSPVPKIDWRLSRTGPLGSWRSKHVPPPEELFVKAKIPSGRSTMKGLVNICEHMSEHQRSNLAATLEYQFKGASAKQQLNELLSSTGCEWLKEMLHDD